MSSTGHGSKTKKYSPKTLDWLLPLIAACIASLITVGAGSKGLHQPLFPWIPGDPNDNAFNNWVLERNYQLLKSGLAWTDIQKLFTTNSFWPLTNTLAWSDNWIVLTPVYALFRLLTSSGQAFTALIGLCLATNFVACYRLSGVGSQQIHYRLVAALLSAFSLTSLAQLFASHAQLMPAFAGVLAVDTIARSFTRQEDIAEGQKLTVQGEGILIGTILLLLQLAIGFYQGVFFALAGCFTITLGFAPWEKNKKIALNTKKLKRLSKANILTYLAFVGLMVMNAIIYSQYYLFSKQSGARQWQEVASMIPTIFSYGHNHLAIPANVTIPAPIQQMDIPVAWEHSLFPGYAFYLLLILALWLWQRQEKAYSLSLIGGCCLLMLAISTGIGGHDKLITAWYLLYSKIPGFAALRAVTRISIPLTLLAAPILANGLDSLERVQSKNKMGPFLVALTILYLLGNVVSPGLTSFSMQDYKNRVNHLTASVKAISSERHCSSFFLASPEAASPERQILAMWTSLKTNIPTISGYSGWLPQDGWRQSMNEATMNQWLSDQGLSQEEIKQACWIGPEVN
jgi:hypothetical protein